ncbi:MAG: hypothetical protein CV089_07675 [Nitrospira sp. WS110]|nr:hypothetical protein [Nitrospira sp. WS110]
MEHHTTALAIALQIGATIRVDLEDRGAAIPAGENMIEPTGDVEANKSYACLTPIRDQACSFRRVQSHRGG